MPDKFSVIAKNGMVASSQPLATLAGVEILMNGGNAIDAAIATAAVLGVVEPSSIGIGSDAFCLFYSAKDRAIKALDASGRSPYAMGLDFCRKSRFKEMPQRGIHSVTVPGAVHGWTTLLNAYGTKKLSEVLQAAIRHADVALVCAPVVQLEAVQRVALRDVAAPIRSAAQEYGGGVADPERLQYVQLLAARVLEVLAQARRQAQAPLPAQPRPFLRRGRARGTPHLADGRKSAGD